MARRFSRFPGAVHRAAVLGLKCAFDLRLVAPPAAADRLADAPTAPASWSAAPSPTANAPAPQAATRSSTSKTKPAFNIVVSVGHWRTSKSYARDANALLVRGIVENATGAVNLVADQLRPLDPRVAGRSRDFR